jgi:hypothetical protein
MLTRRRLGQAGREFDDSNRKVNQTTLKIISSRLRVFSSLDFLHAPFSLQVGRKWQM